MYLTRDHKFGLIPLFLQDAVQGMYIVLTRGAFNYRGTSIGARKKLESPGIGSRMLLELAPSNQKVSARLNEHQNSLESHRIEKI